MKLVRQLLDAKGHEVISITPDASVLDAIKRMAEKSIGALAVMDGPALVGIVTERDYARKVILKGRSSESTQPNDYRAGSELPWITTLRSARLCFATSGDRVLVLPRIVTSL